MNKLSLIFFFIVSSIISQNNTEIYLFDITEQLLGADSVHEGNFAPPDYFESYPKKHP